MHERDHLAVKYARFIEGEVSGDLEKRMEEELRALGSDGEAIIQMRQNRLLLQGLGEISTSVGFEQRLHAKVRAEGNSARSATFRSSLTDWRGLSMAACMVLLMAFGGYYLFQNPVETDLPVQQSRVIDPLNPLQQNSTQPAVADDETLEKTKKDSISNLKRDFNGQPKGDVQFINEQKVQGK